MKKDGNRWKHMKKWKQLDIDKHRWKQMYINGNKQKQTEIDGYRWIWIKMEM